MFVRPMYPRVGHTRAGRHASMGVHTFRWGSGAAVGIGGAVVAAGVATTGKGGDLAATGEPLFVKRFSAKTIMHKIAAARAGGNDISLIKEKKNIN